MFWLLLLAVVILGAVYRRLSMRRIYQLTKQIKSDIPALPLIGHAHYLIGDRTDKMKALQLLGREAIKQGGITDVWFGLKYFIVVADAEILEVVMKTCLQKDNIANFIQLLTGNGSIFAPVSIWRPRRKLVAPTFSPKNLNSFVDVFSRQSSIMVSQLKRASEGSFPVWDYMTSYAMDSVCETTLGISVCSQHNPEHPFLKAFETSSQLFAERICTLWLHPTSVFKMTSQYRTLMKSTAVLCDFVGQIIKIKRQQLLKGACHKETSNVDGTNKYKTFLELLIESGGDNGFNDLELQEEALVMVMAGTDTSAVGASFTAVMLSRHQEVQDKVYQELIEVLGDTDRPIVAEDLPRLKYLEAVIKETLRLHPPVPYILRKVEKDVTLPSGLTLVDGCSIGVSIWAVHRNPKHWGLDAEEFRPERFFEYYNTRAFMPFSTGPRNCLGNQYAMMSMKTAVASVVRQFRVLPAAEDIVHDGLSTKFKPIKVAYEIMMKDVNKFLIRLESRN